MRMYVTRHGQTDWNIEKRLQGRSDIPLNETGRAQARECGAALQHAGIELIITSPLSRAAETGEIIRRFAGDVPLIHDELLLERDFGTMNGEVADERDAEKWPPEVGAESKESLNRRLWTAMENYRRAYPDKTILVVTHGAALHSLLNQVMGGKLSIRPAELKNGGVNCIEYVDRPEMRLFNLSAEEYAVQVAEARMSAIN